VYVGLVKLRLAIGDARSLKDKRMVVRRIKDRVRERLSVTLAEVGEQDVWQRAELGGAIASGDRGKALALVDEVVRVAMTAGGAQIVAIAKDVVPFAGELAPLPEVDDRTGSGDKAAGKDDWVPDAWREEIDR
jgi:uncharacterized protein YlxP (DUF503 family)